MSHKSEKLAAFVRAFEGSGFDPYYVGFFELFNRGQYFEAHEVLEEIWLRNPGGKYSFYKGLIQLAGAFVHLQKNRPQPAAALFRLAEANLRRYPSTYDGLDLVFVLSTIEQWLGLLSTSTANHNPFHDTAAPRLVLRNLNLAPSAHRIGSAQ